MLEVTTHITVSENDIDELQHVNNTKYPVFLEKARWDWYHEAGVSVEERKKRNLATVLVKIEIQYLKEARLGDSLRIVTRSEALGTKSFVLRQSIYNQRDEHINETVAKIVMFDSKERKSIRVVEEFVKQFQGLEM